MFYKSVMLLGGGLGERLEPVGIVACAIVDGPLFHTLGHAVGDASRQGFLVVNSVDERVVGRKREIFKHLGTVEYLAGVISLRTLFGNLHCNGFAVGGFLNNFES